MKKKIVYIIALAMIFLASSAYSTNLRTVNPANMGMLAGLGALVLSYFVSRLVKSGIFKAEEKA